MANLKASKKAIKVSEKKAKQNVVFTSRVKNSTKKLEKAILANDKEQANELLKQTKTNIDQAYGKGLMKENTKNRKKARLTKKVKEMGK
ncbi:MAG: 30S ribosomal protein S20 [Mollicutes bacterium]|jgi:ribosomal protein S20|nr:30S ribosomal protein S20 [Mollicutes bacterium]